MVVQGLQNQQDNQGWQLFREKQNTLRQWMLLINFWAYEIPVCTAGEMLEVSKETAINVYQWLRRCAALNFSACG